MAGVVAFLPGLVWALPIFALAELRRRDPDLAAVPPLRGIPLSVIIPARNESVNIETVISSILASEYDAFEVLIVDDCSTDDTAEKVERFATRDARVKLIRGAPLPDGWRGKPWACSQGAAAATGDILIFTDADTRHAPSLFGHTVAAMQRDAADLLTVLPAQRCVSFWERVIQPQILVILAIRYSPARVNRATRPDQVCANGQYIVMKRSAYVANGGHGAVKAEIVEDLALAQQCIRNGGRMLLMFAPTLLETRMYRSLAGLIEGWSKNLYLGARMSAPRIPMARTIAPFLLLFTVAFWLVPIALLAFGAAIPVAMTGIVASVLFWCLAVYGMEIPFGYGLAYPLGAVMVMYITVRSIVRGEGTVEWRGRVYRA